MFQHHVDLNNLWPGQVYNLRPSPRIGMDALGGHLWMSGAIELTSHRLSKDTVQAYDAFRVVYFKLMSVQKRGQCGRQTRHHVMTF